MPHEDARQIMVAGRGSHFDPDVLDAFLELEDEFREVAARYRDSDDDMNAVRARVEAVPEQLFR
jgi:putative two-component system response regulator